MAAAPDGEALAAAAEVVAKTQEMLGRLEPLFVALEDRSCPDVEAAKDSAKVEKEGPYLVGAVGWARLELAAALVA